MPRFAHPAFLLLIAPAAAALAARLRSPRSFRAAMGLPAASALGRLRTPAWARAARFLPDACLAGALVLAAAALARPQKAYTLAPAEASGIDIMLAVDTSLSMSALDFNPLNRLDAAKSNARAFIQERPNDRIGIVVFGGYAFLECPPTMDHAALLDFLDLVSLGMTQQDGTAIGDAIATAVQHLQSSRAASKVVILLTDGRNNVGTIDPLTAAKAAAAVGVKVYTIGTGARGRSLMPVDDPRFGRRLVEIDEDIDEEALAKIADTTGGRTYRATSLPELKEIYADIDRLEKSKLDVPPATAADDLYPWLLWPAVVLLLLARTVSAAVVKLP